MVRNAPVSAQEMTNGVHPAPEWNDGVEGQEQIHRRRLTMALEAKTVFEKTVGTQYAPRDLADFLAFYLLKRNESVSGQDLVRLLEDCNQKVFSPEQRFRESLLGKDGENIPVLDALGPRRVVRTLADGTVKQLGFFLQKLGKHPERPENGEPQWPARPPMQDSDPRKKGASSADEWRQDDAEESDGRRRVFAEALVASMVKNVLADNTLRNAPSWETAELRLQVTQHAIRGAIEHLCLLYMEELIPAALDQVESKSMTEALADQEEDDKDTAADSQARIRTSPVNPEHVRQIRLEKIRMLIRCQLPQLLNHRFRNSEGEVVRSLTDLSRSEFGVLLQFLQGVLHMQVQNVASAPKMTKKDKDHRDTAADEQAAKRGRPKKKRTMEKKS